MASRRAASLRARLLLLVMLAVLPALGVILYTGLQQRRLAASEARQEAMRLGRTIAADQHRLILETRQFLSLLAQLDQVHGSDSESCSRFLAQLRARDERFANLGVIRADGEVTCSAVPMPDSVNLADRTYFRRAVTSRDFAVGDHQIGRITGEATVNFGYPILDPQQRVLGVVYAALPLSWIRERIAEAELPPGSVITVVDPSLTVLARFPEENGWLGRSIRGSALATAIQESGGEGTAETVGLDRVKRLYAVTPLQDLPGSRRVFVTVGIPSRVAYAAVDRGLSRNLITLALLGLLTLAATWWGSDAFVLRQIRALLAATRRLGAGDLSARAPVAVNRGEISELGHSFNAMAAAIQERDTDITAHVSRIGRLNRVYAVLSGINSAMLRIRTEDELLRELCRIAVEDGGLHLAAVHRVDPNSQARKLVGWANATAGEPEGLPGSKPRQEEHGLVEAVLREDCEIIVNDTGTDPDLLRWEELAGAPGCRSAAVFPLRADQTIVGVLTLLADEPNFFDAEELRLLRDLAADTSLGLQYLARGQRVEYLANYDTLTNLPNRTLFADRLQQAIVGAKQDGNNVAVLVAGIDRLGEINAALGHHVGDTVLREIASYLSSAICEGDTIARLGSGEFGIVLADVPNPERVATRANEILTQIPQTVLADGEPVFVTLGIGGAIYPMDGESGATLIQNAVQAQQAAASTVANTLGFHSADINQQAQEKRQLEHELRSALERNELALFYQPVVDVQRRVIIGVEALIRWTSSTLGNIPPSTFIPVAEETGLIKPIGEWIVVTAAQQGQCWHQSGFEDIRINVNVSVDQLREGNFVERVTTILRETGFDPQFLSLGLEITESELMENVQDAVNAIVQFREMGLAIYIDDFGTGYSSLSYLRQLPIDTLKIDASFIRDIPGDPDAVAVVRAIIAMAKSLELRTIAEGVETEEQFSVLQQLGCDAIQGYLFGRPAPAQDIEPLFGRTL
ncbi:MAG: EAL domain-containing protein [Gemmatimonadota bacterium]|nr:EAL domain-containing protein [Gemmatimonadota bacterium]